MSTQPPNNSSQQPPVPATIINQPSRSKNFFSKIVDKIGYGFLGIDLSQDGRDIDEDLAREQKRKQAKEKMKQEAKNSKNPFTKFYKGLRATFGWIPIEEEKKNQPSNTPPNTLTNPDPAAPQVGLTPEEAERKQKEQEEFTKDLQEYASLIIQLKNNQIDRLSLFNKNNVAINQPVNSQNQNNTTPGSKSVLSADEQKNLNLILKNISDLLVKTNALRLKYQNNPGFWLEIDRCGIQKEVKEFEDIVSLHQLNNQTPPVQPTPASVVPNQSSSVPGGNGATQPTQTAFSPVVTSQTIQQLPNTNGSAQTNVNSVPPIPSQIPQPKSPDQQGQQPLTHNFEIKEIKKFHEQMQCLQEFKDALYQQMDLFINNQGDPNRLTTLQNYLKSIYLAWLPVRDDFRRSILGYMNYLQTEGVTNENLDQRNKLTNQIWQAKEDIEKLLVHSNVEFYNILQFSNILITTKQFNKGYDSLLVITQEIDKITNNVSPAPTSNKPSAPNVSTPQTNSEVNSQGPEVSTQVNSPIPQEEVKEPVITRTITTLDGVGKVIQVQLGAKKKDFIADNNQNLTQHQKALLAFKQRQIARITPELNELSQIVTDKNINQSPEQTFNALQICKDIVNNNQLDLNLADKVDKYLFYLANNGLPNEQFYNLVDGISNGIEDIETSKKAVALAMLINNQNLVLNGAKDNLATWSKIHNDDPNNTDWINSEWEKNEAVLQAFFDNTKDAIAKKIILAEITAKFENGVDKNGYGLSAKFKELLGFEVKAMQIEQIYRDRGEYFASLPDEKKHALGILFQQVAQLITEQVKKNQ